MTQGSLFEATNGPAGRPPLAIIVCGSREWTDVDAVTGLLDETSPDVVLHGNAPGADVMVYEASLDLAGAQWDEYGSDAGPRRNRKMLEVLEALRELVAELPRVKIGVAKNIRKRLSSLQTSAPGPLKLLAVAGGGQPEEYGYHQRFKKERLHGEWFNLCGGILEEVGRLRGGLP